jgi:hypothetical protein
MKTKFKQCRIGLAVIFSVVIGSIACAVMLVNHSTPIRAEVDYVAMLTIYADNSSNSSSMWNGSSTSGHSFLLVENLTDNPIFAGKMSVPAYGAVTMGTWLSLLHMGLWYNLESYFVNVANEYVNRVSLSYPLTQGQLDSMNDKIINDKNCDHWSIGRNCSSFSKNVWNHVVPMHLSSGSPNTPSHLKNYMLSNYPNQCVVGRPFTHNSNYGNYEHKKFVFFPCSPSLFAHPLLEPSPTEICE